MKFYKGPLWLWWLWYRWFGYGLLAIREMDTTPRMLEPGWKFKDRCPDPLCTCSRPK